MGGSCQDVLAEMVHTKDGSRAVREFIARGTAKVCPHSSMQSATMYLDLYHRTANTS